MAIGLVGALVLGACGDDDDDATASDGDTSEQSSSEGSDDSADDADSSEEPEASTDFAGTASDGDLIVPRDYLQGVWCDNEGSTWTIEGDNAILDDGAGGTGTFPVDILFIAGPGVDLVSQSDDGFVFRSADDEVSFTRGGC